MKVPGARAVAYPAVALLALGAIIWSRPLPERRPAATLAAASRPVWRERVDTLGRGESLVALLERGGLRGRAQQVIRSATSLDTRRIPAGMAVTLSGPEADSVPTRVTLHLAIDRLLHLTRADSGWISREERLPWTTDTMVVRGSIASSLYAALDAAAPELPTQSRSELAWTVADIFEYRVDMSRDLQPGDEFRVLVERSSGPQGAMRMGKVLAVTFEVGGNPLQAIRHGDGKSGGRYFDREGKSLQAAFLRAPLQFRRISSVFGMRKHPILGTWRAHKGMDYAAASGTPIRAIGDGTVLFAGRRSGYGNSVDIRHANGYVSRYGHLRGFAPATRRGARVSISQTIGYVGMTGLATAPHLHFEVLVGGVQRNPRVALSSKTGEPLPRGQRATFDRTRNERLALLGVSTSDHRVAAVN